MSNELARNFFGYKSNYKILSLVGRGQFGRVFAAIERQSGKLVALKELQTKQLSTSGFLRELTFLVTLDHFNIVPCKAIEHGHKTRYIVMDYCEGGTLRQLLNDSSSITLNQSLKLVIDVLHGLEYAHGKGIVHRDIKPENILLKISDHTYTAHIADFGIAKLNQEIAAQNVLGNTGSPAYMAPEQFYGEYSYNCDLYGVGVILYELVTGKRPFSGMPKELLTAHLSQPVVISGDIPLLLRLAIAKSLEKLPSRRFQTATEMLKSLKLVQAILEVDPNPKIPLEVKPKFKSLVPQTQSALDRQISHLEIFSDQVYLGSGDRLLIWRYQDANLTGKILSEKEVSLNQTIQNLQLSSTGCLITTSTSIHYLFPDHSLEFIDNFPAKRLITTVNTQGSWCGISYANEKLNQPEFKIYRLVKGKFKLQPFSANLYSWQHLIALDAFYAIGIHQTQVQTTELHLFNRRGNWLANFSVQIQLDAVVYNPLFTDHLLATETSNPGMVILISLKQFNLKRIKVDIVPILIKPCPLGYLLSDCYGKMILLDQYGEYLGRFQIPLTEDFMVTAIATSPTCFLVASASASSSQSQLQIFSWQNENLDKSNLVNI